MGKGGVAPDYFLYRMQWWEVNLYMDGLNMRDRTSWEQHRSLVHSIASMFCGKDKVPGDTHTFMPLPWDQDEEDRNEKYDEQYINEMRDMMRRYNGS